MAKRKRSNRPPQLQHGKKSIPSQHDKRSRLCTPNPTRRKTESASVPLLGGIAVVITAMQTLMHGRIGFRLPIVWLVPRGLVVAERRAVGFELPVWKMIGIVFTNCLFLPVKSPNRWRFLCSS
jgi:hypothetical protein